MHLLPQRNHSNSSFEYMRKDYELNWLNTIVKAWGSESTKSKKTAKNLIKIKELDIVIKNDFG